MKHEKRLTVRRNRPTFDMSSNAVSSNPSGMRSFQTIALENSIVSIHVRASCHKSVNDSKSSPVWSNRTAAPVRRKLDSSEASSKTPSNVTSAGK